jgi:OFA family oxalate/formate antiporter-like MFS transporter
MGHLPRRIYYGWFVLAAVGGINFANSATAIGVLTVFIIPFTEDFGWSRTQISAVTSVGAVLGAIAAPFTGRLTDKVGARLPLTVGGLVIALATLGLANMQSLQAFAVAFGMARLADQACVQAPSPPAVAKWFQRYRGRALAVLFFANSAGGVVLPLLVQVVIQVWHWRTAWAMLGIVMLLMGVIPCAWLVRRQPEDLGLPLDGVPPPLPGGEDQASPNAVRRDAPVKEGASWRLGEALTSLTFWLLLGAVFLFGVASTGVALHLVPYLVQQGIAPTAAVGVVSTGFLSSAMATMLWGFLADRCSSRILLAVAYATKAASLAVLVVAGTIPLAYLYAVLQGCAEAGQRTLFAVVLASYYGRQHLGAIYGSHRAMQVGGFALGPLISGATFDVTQTYRRAFIAFLLLSVVGVALVALAKRPQRRAGA